MCELYIIKLECLHDVFIDLSVEIVLAFPVLEYFEITFIQFVIR